MKNMIGFMVQQNGKIHRYGLWLMMSILIGFIWSCGQKNDQPASNQVIQDQNDSIAGAEFDSLSQSLQKDTFDIEAVD
ncbi:MAG: hypothetical protein R6T91_04625 [Bacteroidales bacterium]